MRWQSRADSRETTRTRGSSFTATATSDTQQQPFRVEAKLEYESRMRCYNRGNNPYSEQHFYSKSSFRPDTRAEVVVNVHSGTGRGEGIPYRFTLLGVSELGR